LDTSIYGKRAAYFSRPRSCILWVTYSFCDGY
jgi:hypothetical protein